MHTATVSDVSLTRFLLWTRNTTRRLDVLDDYLQTRRDVQGLLLLSGHAFCTYTRTIARARARALSLARPRAGRHNKTSDK